LSLYAVREHTLHAYLDAHPDVAERVRRNSADGRPFIYPYVWELLEAGIEVRSVAYLDGSGYRLGGPDHRWITDLAALRLAARNRYAQP